MPTHTLVVVLASLALATAIPSSEVESAFSDTWVSTDLSEARVAAEQAISLLQAQGMGDNACNDLAQSTIKEITDSVKADQKVLDSLSKGSNCKTEGDALVSAARQAESLAKKNYDDANNAYNRAKSAKVNFKSVAFGSLKSPSCNVLDNSNYQSQLNSLNNAKNLRDRRSREYQNAKDQHAKAKKTAAKAKEDCACKARDTMNKAWAAASDGKSQAANDKAWRKAQQMSCVIKGVSMNSCKVAATPAVKKPSLASGVAAMCKKAPASGGASGYKFGTLGQVACPGGYSRIYDEATCKTAMKSVTGKSVSSVGKHCWQKHPRGCFTHYGRNRSTRILVNNNGCGKTSGTTYSDSQSICKGSAASGYKFGTLGQVACPGGYSRIYDEATCKTAMKSVTGKNVASVGKHCWQAHPRGCFTHYGRNRSTRILVNNNGCGKTSGTTYSDSQSICKRL